MGIPSARVETTAKIATLQPFVARWQQIHCFDGGGGEENLLRATSIKTGRRNVMQASESSPA
jgi:hypothetical protein